MNSLTCSAKAFPNVVLLRVAIDTGSGGICGPVFKDGRFEYIPIDTETDCLNRTYGNTPGRWGGKLIDYFPPRLQERMRGQCMHVDPEFKTFTYGDPTFPKQVLARLKRGDLLVFYAGLQGWGDCLRPPALYFIGYFVVTVAGSYPELRNAGQLRPFQRNWHVIHGDTKGRWSRNRKRKTNLVLVKGGKGSRLLKTAFQISGAGKAKDRNGHPVFVLDPRLTEVFGNFTKLNAIQRSTPRWVRPEFCATAAAFVRHLQ